MTLRRDQVALRDPDETGDAAAAAVNSPLQPAVNKPDLALPGGGVPQTFDARNVTPAPTAVREHQLAGVSSEYKAAVLRDGIPFRPHGLFPPADLLLTHLATDASLLPFEKHLPGASHPYELLPKGGWTTGDAAAARGLDLRLFYKKPESSATYGTIQGAVRFGDGACIGNGYWSEGGGWGSQTASWQNGRGYLLPAISGRQHSYPLFAAG